MNYQNTNNNYNLNYTLNYTINYNVNLKNNRVNKFNKDIKKTPELPCFSIISSGFCAYDERCCFIHDARLCSLIFCNKKKIKRNVNNLSENRKVNDNDIFFWPKLKKEESFDIIKYDNRILYDLFNSDINLHKFVISMWYHLLYILSDDLNNFLENSLIKQNIYTNRPRLSCFFNLSNKKN